jgi:hypothetical protein
MPVLVLGAKIVYKWKEEQGAQRDSLRMPFVFSHEVLIHVMGLMESLTPRAHQVAHNFHCSSTLSSQCIHVTPACPVQQTLLPWLGEFILKSSYNSQRGTCMMNIHEPTLMLTSFQKVICRVGWMHLAKQMCAGMHLANRCVQKRILPTDACGNTYCHQMHTG